MRVNCSLLFWAILYWVIWFRKYTYFLHNIGFLNNSFAFFVLFARIVGEILDRDKELQKQGSKQLRSTYIRPSNELQTNLAEVIPNPVLSCRKSLIHRRTLFYIDSKKLKRFLTKNEFMLLTLNQKGMLFPIYHESSSH